MGRGIIAVMEVDGWAFHRRGTLRPGREGAGRKNGVKTKLEPAHRGMDGACRSWLWPPARLLIPAAFGPEGRERVRQRRRGPARVEKRKAESKGLWRQRALVKKIVSAAP